MTDGLSEAYETKQWDVFCENNDLRLEDAELRELVRHMYTCMGNVDADGNHECFVCKYEGAKCDFDRRMRELVVEVEECITR